MPDSMPKRSKRPSSMRTRHLEHISRPPHGVSISTPRPWAASRTVAPSSTSPRLPEGWKMTRCFSFSVIGFLLLRFGHEGIHVQTGGGRGDVGSGRQLIFRSAGLLR